jgi:uncharacterized protein with NRDE domain
MLQNHLQKVVDNWKKEGLKLEKPLMTAELNAAFANSNIATAKEIIEVYSGFNGFADEELDSECITFWTIQKMLEEYQKESQYVVFADFLIDSHWYAFKVNDENTASVYLYYGDEDTTKISNSFAEFFELYLTEPSKLFV